MLTQSGPVGQYSIDAIEHERDEVFPQSNLLQVRSARTYYDYKRTICDLRTKKWNYIF